MKGVSINLKNSYEQAKIEVISFTACDIVTASGDGSVDTGSDNKTENGWTPIGW